MKTELTTSKQILYRVTMIGRTAGAIGVFYPVTLEISADSEAEARERMYDTHEPLHSVRVDPIAVACPNCGQWSRLGGDCLNECVRRGFAEVQ